MEREPEKTRLHDLAHAMRTGTDQDCLDALRAWFDDGEVIRRLEATLDKPTCLELADRLLEDNPETAFLLYAISYLLEERESRRTAGVLR